MDLVLLLTTLGAAAAVIGVVYQFLRNFKSDINGHIDRLDKRMDNLDRRMDNFEFKINSLEERIFWLVTGKKLEDAIIEERMKRPKTNP